MKRSFLRLWFMNTLLVIFALSTSLYGAAQSLPIGSLVVWHPSNSMLATANNVTVKIVDANTNQVLNTLPNFPTSVNSIVWSPDGTRLAIAMGTTIQVWHEPWNPSTAQLLINFGGHEEIVSSVAWDPNGSQIGSANLGEAKIWDATSGQVLFALIQDPGPLGLVTWNPDGTKLATAGIDSRVVIWNPTTGQPITSFSMPIPTGFTAITAITWSPDGTKMATSSEDGIVRGWDVNSNQPLEIFNFIRHGDGVFSLAWSPDGSQLATGSTDGTIRIWNVITGELIDIIQANVLVSSSTWSPDGTKFAYGTENGTLQVIPAPGVDPCAPPPGSPSPIGSSASDLINAIDAANANGSSPDVMVLAEDATYTLTTVNNTDDGDNGLPAITTPITLYGSCATITRDAGAAAFRLFKVNGSGTLTLDNLTVSGGWAAGYGGAAYVKGTLVARNVTFTGNHADDDGGALYSSGTLTLRGSRFFDNTSGTGRTIARRPIP